MLLRLLPMATSLFLLSCTATMHQPAATDATSHEYAPLEEKEFSYRDWTYTRIHDAKPVNLRSAIYGKKLVLVVYFAPWCGNWRNEMPIVFRLHEKYKNHGFDVIGVSEYGSNSESLTCVGDPPPFVVVSESESREERENTPHHGYRHATGDKRKWGSPWNIFIEPSRISEHSDVLLTKAWIANGEIIESEAEVFIKRHLGLE